MKTPSKNIKDGSIYFLFDEDTLVYVGLSVNPCSRIGTHTRDKTFTHYRIMSCRKERMFYWESILITRYKPKYNKAGLERKKPPKQKVKTRFSHPPKASSGLRFEEGWAIGYEPQVEPYIHLSRKNLQKIIYGRVKHE